MRFLVVLVLGFCILSSCKQKKPINETANGRGIERAEKAGLKLAMQSYTFHQLSLEEAIEQTAELGIKYIEIYPEHIVKGQSGEKPFSIDISDKEIDEIKEFAKAKGVEIVGYGVFKTTEEADWKKLFAFAKKLEVSYITCEPQYNHLDLVEKLAEEYNISINIHNSIEPSDYSDPTVLYEKIADRSDLMGICGDLGNWKRSGFDVVETIEKIENRLGSIHLKDLCPVEFDDNIFSDCLLNVGILDIDETIMILRNNKFNGYLAIEYISDQENPAKDISKSIYYYDQITYRLFPE